MKKFVVLSSVVVLILAFGAIVYGQEEAPVLEFKASGSIDMTSDWKKNAPDGGNADIFYGPVLPDDYLPGGAAFDKTEAYMKTRGRLKFNAMMGKEVSGTIQFEMDATPWGSIAGDRNKVGYWSADRAGVEVKHLYITFGMPWIPVPITVQAGIQPIAERNILYNDGSGITVAAKVDPATIQLMWFKPIENLNYASDDSDIFGLDLNAKVQTLTVGGYSYYYHMNTYPLGVSGAPSYSANMWWFGLYADGKLGPVMLNFDLGFDSGKVKSLVTTAEDVDYSGMGIRAQLSYPWEKFTFGLLGEYGTGANVEKTGNTGLPGDTTLAGNPNKKVGAYVFPPGSEGGPPDIMILHGDGVFRSDVGYYDVPATGMSRFFYGGEWMVKLFASTNVTDQWKATLSAAYVGDTTKNGNTVGNARKSPYGAADLRDDKSVGWEVNLYNEIQVYKNLMFGAGVGYVIAGKGMDYWDATAGANKSSKNPYAVITRLIYSF